MQFVKLQTRIEKLIKPNEDSVRVYVLDAEAVKRTITYGSEKPRQDDTIILIIGQL
jgi:CRISPR-associated protein Cas2